MKPFRQVKYKIWKQDYETRECNNKLKAFVEIKYTKTRQVVNVLPGGSFYVL